MDSPSGFLVNRNGVKLMQAIENNSKSPVTRSRSVNFKDHERLVHMLARKGYARLQALKISVLDYEDVFQEMSMSFVRAADKWNPDFGTSFTAYFGRAAFNDFNKVVERLTERAAPVFLLGDHIPADGRCHEDPTEGEIVEYLLTAEGGFAESTEDAVARREDALRNFKKLTRTTQELVEELIDPSQDIEAAFGAVQEHFLHAKTLGEKPDIPKPRSINLTFIAKQKGLSQTSLRRAISELKAVYEVSF